MCIMNTFRGIYYYLYFSFVENRQWIAPLRTETLQSMPSVLQLILPLGLTIGVWCCLDDHAPLTPINSHVNKQHQCLTHRSLSVLAELPYWSLHSNFNSSISYKRSKTLKASTLAEGGWSTRELNLFFGVFGVCQQAHQLKGTQQSGLFPTKTSVSTFSFSSQTSFCKMC